MQDDAIAYLAVVVDRHVGIEDTSFANSGIVLDDDMWIDLRALADGDILADIGECSHIAVVAHMGCLCDAGLRMNALLAGFHALVHLQQPRYTLVGVVNADESCLDGMLQLQVVVDQNHRRLCVIEIMSIFGIRQERDGPCAAFFYFGKRCYLRFCVAFHCSVDEISYLAGCKLHRITIANIINNVQKQAFPSVVAVCPRDISVQR